jgi:hypothetical protein
MNNRVIKNVFGKNNLQLQTYAKFYTAYLDPTSLFFFACPKNEPKKAQKSNASPRKVSAPLAGFLGQPA